ncbi:10045_t:CDS:10 [Entrophospora sp. SA101]|nr:10045_t:CDS:10 [Entrophospora sp. SA101]
MNSIIKKSKRGLTNEEVIETRFPIYGLNELSGQGNVNAFMVLAKQFLNALMLILMIAMIVSFVTKDYIEAGVIGFVAITNALIGFFQEYRAEKTMESLRKMTSPTARVIRGEASTFVPTNTLVPGDILVIEEGDVVGADARLFECQNLEIDEALLTGESVPVAKFTTVTKGRGKGIVISTGMETEIGKIAKSLSSSSIIQRSPLQKAMDMMAYILFGIAVVLSVIVFGVNKWQFTREVFIYAVSVSIAILPEGLVAVITLTMALGVRKMAKNKAIVRKLSALEALGSVTNICSDKTGTLTQSKMIATNAWLLHEGFYKITGRKGYSPNEVTFKNMSYAFRQLVQTAALCNMAVIRKGAIRGEWNVIGDPTEGALQVFSHKAGLPKPVLESEEFKFKLIMEYNFDTILKRMSVLYKNEITNEYYVFMKGATESILKKCTKFQVGDDVVEREVNDDGSDEKFKLEINNSLESLASKGLRVLSLAYRKINNSSKTDKEFSMMTREEVDNDMIFLGFVGIYDPPRPESKDAVMKCFGAGIEVHMLTGDHPLTAAAIAKEIGIIPSNYLVSSNNINKIVNDDNGSQSQLVMAATQFDALTDKEIDELKELPKVIARCSPETKVKMIEALHRRKKFVAMTGDGVNDSPSLKKADIGIAMGMGGSDVAKQASDIVLTDDNFATIVSAISEGRRIFVNIQKFISHLLSGNVSEIVALVIGLSFIDTDGLSLNPMSPLQILFLNMVTSSPPAMGLGVERASKDIMRYPPQSRRGLFSWEVIGDTLFYGCIMGGLTLTNFSIVIYAAGDGNLGSGCNHSLNPETEDACEQVFRARVVGGALIAIPTFYIPGLNTKVFHQLGFSWEWGLILGSIIIFEIVVEIYKFSKRRYCAPLMFASLVPGGEEEDDNGGANITIV